MQIYCGIIIVVTITLITGIIPDRHYSMKMEEEQVWYYNGSNFEDGSKQSTVQLYHVEDLCPIHTTLKAETNHAHQTFLGFSTFPSLLCG